MSTADTHIINWSRAESDSPSNKITNGIRPIPVRNLVETRVVPAFWHVEGPALLGVAG